MGGAIRFVESTSATSGAIGSSQSAQRRVASDLDVVLLLGAAGNTTQTRRDAWCRACAEHAFEAARFEAWPAARPPQALWESAVVIALLETSVASLDGLENLARAANRALVVLPSDTSTLPPATQEALGCVTLRLGQESALLAWYRKHLTHRQQVPRPRASVNLTERTLCIDRECIPLQPRETQLLAILAEAQVAHLPERVCARLWGGDDEGKRRMLRQYFYQLRQKLGRHSGLLRYVRGEGYRCFLDLELVEMQ